MNMLGFIKGKMKGAESNMLWIFMLIIITLIVIAIIWTIFGKTMGWDPSGLFPKP